MDSKTKDGQPVRVSLHPPRRWLQRLRWFLLLTLGVVIGVVGGVYYYISRPHRVAAVAGQLLEDLTGTQVTIDSATFSLDGGVRLDGIRMSVPGMPQGADELFSAERVFVRVNPWAVLEWKFEAEQMIFIRPVLSLTEYVEGKFNYELLRELRMLDEPAGPLPRLPRIEIVEGLVRYGFMDEQEHRAYDGPQLAGRLIPDPDETGHYEFELQSTTVQSTEADQAKFARLTGRLDLEKLDVEMALSELVIDPHRNVLPRQIQQWWDLFEPSGSLSNVRFGYDPATGPRASVEIHGVALTLPALTDDPYRSRMTDVHGTFHFDNKRIRIDNLEGLIEGLKYRVNGTIDGYNEKAPFHIVMDTEPFRIPEKPRYMPALPTAVQNVFEQLSPVGWLRVSISLSRNAGGELDSQGTANILSGADVFRATSDPSLRQALRGEGDGADLNSRGHYFQFPYELSNCKGLITFNRRAIEVKYLTGDTPGGGTATITGRITPPRKGEQPGMDLAVNALNVSFNEALYEALPPRHRDSLDAFFDEAAWRRLRDAGHFVDSTQRQADELRRQQLHRLIEELGGNDPQRLAEAEAELKQVQARIAKPLFDLAGRFDAQVTIRREPGPDEDVVIHTTMILNDVNAVVSYFPYPVRVKKGRMIISPDGTVFDGIVFEGLNGGYGGLSGSIMRDPADREKPAEPKMLLTATDAPFDALLSDVIRPPHSDWLARLGLDGTFALDGRIFRRPDDGEVDIDMNVRVADATARPDQGEVKLTDVNGHLKLTTRSIDIQQMTGRLGEAPVAVGGVIDWKDPKNPVVDLDAVGHAMRFEDRVLELICLAVESDEPLQKFWATYEPAGQFDAQLIYHHEGDAHTYRAIVEPASLSFMRRGQRVEVQQTGGQIVIDPEGIELQKFTGRLGSADLTLNGTIELGDEPYAQLTLGAKADQVDAAVRQALPEVVAQVLERLKINGTYDLDLPTLKVRRVAEDRHIVELDGHVKLTAASAQIGLPVTDFHGTLQLQAKPANGDTGAVEFVSLQSSDARLTVSGRQLTDLQLAMRYEPQADRVVVPTFHANCYGGVIDGNGSVTLGEDEMALRLSLSQVDLRKVLTPAPNVTNAAANGNGDRQIDGRVAMSLAVQGSWRDTTKLRGRGSIRISDASLYGVPMAMGLLQITHLSLPMKNEFTGAVSDYYIDHGRIVMERIELESPLLRIAGTGAADYTTKQLDLTLTTSNPNGLNIGPVTQLIDSFRNQFVTIRVTGTTDQPKIQVRQLNGLTQAWRDIFQSEPSDQ